MGAFVIPGLVVLSALVVFAGIAAAKWAKKKKSKIKTLSLQHAVDFEQQLADAGIETDLQSPMLLPDYRSKSVLERSLGRFV